MLTIILLLISVLLLIFLVFVIKKEYSISYLSIVLLDELIDFITMLYFANPDSYLKIKKKVTPGWIKVYKRQNKNKYFIEFEMSSGIRNKGLLNLKYNDAYLNIEFISEGTDSSKFIFIGNDLKEINEVLSCFVKNVFDLKKDEYLHITAHKMLSRYGLKSKDYLVH